MMALVAIVGLLPLATVLAVACGGRAKTTGVVAIGAATGTLAAAITLAVRIDSGTHYRALGGFVYVDSLSAFFALTIAIVVLLASLGSAAYLRSEERTGNMSRFQVRLYFVFFSLFSSGMLSAFLTGNLGLLWVLIEASTLASAALVGLEARSRSLEAAWKYVIISSFGVTVALVATLFLFYSGSALHLTSSQRLTWSYLFVHADGLRPASLRLSFLLAVVGYGTKVGLVPMHTWLPDAHSEAPSPASAMLSAGLLNTGMYAIIRFEAIARQTLGSTYPSRVLLIFGFATIFIGIMFMVIQRNFKRLFAYSSIEHMGIVGVALGIGGTLGLYGALLQVLNHAITKSVLFLVSGHLVLGYHSRQSDDARGVLSAMPVAGGVLLLAAVAVAGSPPFGVFLSELTIVRAAFANYALLGGLFLTFLVIGFVALTRRVFAMAGGDGRAPTPPYRERWERSLATAPLVIGLGCAVVLGLWIPSILNEVIAHSIRAIT
jgi:hydrogenase-4 component F